MVSFASAGRGPRNETHITIDLASTDAAQSVLSTDTELLASQSNPNGSTPIPDRLDILPLDASSSRDKIRVLSDEVDCKGGTEEACEVGEIPTRRGSGFRGVSRRKRDYEGVSVVVVMM